MVLLQVRIKRVAGTIPKNEHKNSLHTLSSLHTFKDLLVSIYHSLHEMKENEYKPYFNNETSVKVDSLFKLATDFSFINILAITRIILDYLL